MKKQLTPEGERTVLLDAARKAMRELDALFALQEIASIASGAGRRKCSEESLIAANRARKILHRALSKMYPQAGRAPGQALDAGSSTDVPSAERSADAKRNPRTKKVKP